MVNILEKLKVAFAGALSDTDKAKIKEFKAKLNEAVKTPTTLAETKVKTKEGAELVIAGDLVNGSKVSMVNPADNSKTDAADGEYELEDGTVITITGGLIVNVAAKGEKPAPSTTPDASQMAAKMSAIETKLSESEKTFNSKLEAKDKEIADLKEQVKFTLESLEKFINIPIVTEKEEPAKKWEDMTALERRRYEKSLNNK